MERKIVRPLILAGGKGKRLLPLTERRLKPLLPVAGSTLLERLLLRLREDGSPIRLQARIRTVTGQAAATDILTVSPGSILKDGEI